MKKLTKLDNALFHMNDRYLYEIALVVLVGLSVVIRIYLTPMAFSGDYIGCIDPWIQQYRQIGAKAGLAIQIDDYYIPYNVILAIASNLSWPSYVLISLVSCIAEYVSAYFIYKIALLILNERGASKASPKAGFVALSVLFLPFTIINGSLWKQCDAVYVCFLIISLYMLLKERYAWMMIMFSIAFSFKLQAIFVLPFLIIIYMVRKDFSIINFFWIPAVYIIAGLPAIICGRGIADTYSIYIKQTGHYEKMTLNEPNFANFGFSDYKTCSTPAILITVAIIIIAAVYFYYKRSGFNKNNVVYLCGWMVWTCCMFLPSMHERYDYAAALLISVYMLMTEDWKMCWTAIVINMCTILTYTSYMFSVTVFDLKIVAVPYLIAYIAVTFDLCKKINYVEKNEK